jgi:hypothetical protein
MSDVAWVVNEAASLTARAQQDKISEIFLEQALKAFSPTLRSRERRSQDNACYSVNLTDVGSRPMRARFNRGAGRD